jgi:hypothetical protein
MTVESIITKYETVFYTVIVEKNTFVLFNNFFILD